MIISVLLISCGNRKTDVVEPDGETVEDKVEDEEASEPVEGAIAYVEGVDIWVMNDSGGDRLNITNSPDKNSDPRISPDGLKVAFTMADGNKNVYVVGRDGTGMKRLTQGTPGDDFSPAWSPDGDTIAFLSTRDHPEGGFPYAEAYLMDPDGGNQRRLSQSEYGLENPAAIWWLPDGGEIAVWETGTGAGTGIALVDLETGEVGRPERLYDILDEQGYLGKVVNCYVVNPEDENLVACTLADLASDPVDREKNGLFIINMADGSRTKVCELSTPISCCWSLDGECLYFTDCTSEGYYGFFMAGKDGDSRRALDWLPQVQLHDDFWFYTYADFHIASSL